MLSHLRWILAIFVVIVLLGSVKSRTFHAEILIPEPVEKIWAVLIDTQAYPEWNPVVIQVDGTLVEGQKVTHSVLFPQNKTVTMQATVARLIPNYELRQMGGTVGLLTFDHQWTLQPTKDGTRVVQHEVDRGIGLWFWNADWIQPAYQNVNEALAKRVANLPKS